MTRRPNRIWTWLWPGLALAQALACAGAARAGDAQAEEQATKAAVIYNVSRFTVWPDNRFGGPTDPVVLCVQPEATLAGSLERVAGKPVGARTLVVRKTNHIDHSCHLAYLDDDEVGGGRLAELRDKGVLTIGETPDFARAGAIQLVTIGRQVRFAINQKNALNSGARLSSNLLRLAVTVR